MTHPVHNILIQKEDLQKGSTTHTTKSKKFLQSHPSNQASLPVIGSVIPNRALVKIVSDKLLLPLRRRNNPQCQLLVRHWIDQLIQN